MLLTLIDIAYFGNSIYDLATTFYKVVLNREATNIVRYMFEASIGRKGSSTYTIKDASVDIFSLVYKLMLSGLTKE